jgi:threonine/homoserine/homoserine lactone efflux protein
MSIFLLFVITFVISALGSMPPGLINLLVMKRSISAGRHAGNFAAFGTFIPEFIYTYIAVYGYVAITENVDIGYQFRVAGAIVFLSLAAYYFFQAPEQSIMTTGDKKKKNAINFWRGFLTAAVNMLVMPFWAFVAATLHTYGYEFVVHSEMITFALGSALGALSIFLVYARLGHLVAYRLDRVVRYTNKFLAVLFLVLGVYQVVKVF